jgi:hypothetical protein
MILVLIDAEAMILIVVYKNKILILLVVVEIVVKNALWGLVLLVAESQANESHSPRAESAPPRPTEEGLLLYP